MGILVGRQSVRLAGAGSGVNCGLASGAGAHAVPHDSEGYLYLPTLNTTRVLE